MNIDKAYATFQEGFHYHIELTDGEALVDYLGQPVAFPRLSGWVLHIHPDRLLMNDGETWFVPLKRIKKVIREDSEFSPFRKRLT